MANSLLERIRNRAGKLPHAVLRRVRRLLTRPPTPLPKITIVTPVYNGAETIRATFESVLNQNYPHLEYIVVDGGSTDGTLAIINEYRRHFTCVISEPDRGMYDAIAKGFACGTGTIFAYLNADDLFEPGALLRVGRYFADHPRSDIIYHEDTVAVDGWRFPNRRQPRFVDFVTLLNGHILYQAAVFFRRYTYEAVGGVNRHMKLAGDWDLWVRMARHFKFRKLDGHPSCFRIRAKQLSADMDGYFREIATERAKITLTLKPLDKLYFRVCNYLTRAGNWLDRKRSGPALYFDLDAADPTTFKAAPAPPGDGPADDAPIPLCPITRQAPDRLLFSTRDVCFGDRRISHMYYHTDSHVAVAHPYISEEALDTDYRHHDAEPTVPQQPVEPSAQYASPYRHYRKGNVLDRFIVNRGMVQRALGRLERLLPVSWHDPTVRDLLSAVSGLIPGTDQALDFLDVNCDKNGLLDRLLQETRWHLFRLARDPQATQIAQQMGLRVWHGSVADAPYVIEPNYHFDVIYLGGAIARLNEPVRALRRLTPLLRDGGLMILSTPNLDAAQLELFGPTWAQWQLPYHRHCFSRKSLGSMAEMAALRMVRCFTRSHPRTTAVSLQLNEFGLGGTVSPNVALEPRLELKARHLNIWAKLCWNWRGRGDYLVAVFQKPK